MNEPNPQTDIARAAEAQAVLTTPVFKEACNRIDAELRMLRESVGMKDTDMHSRLILAEQMWGKLLDHLKSIMVSGNFARERLKLKENFAERMAESIRRGVRL